MSARRSLTWLHISDLHFGHADANYRFDQQGVTNAIVENASTMAKRLGPPDLIIVTGDIAFSGQPQQYAQAHEWLTRLRTAAGGTPRLFLVPGNHDVDRAQAKPIAASALHEALRREPKKLDELLAAPSQMQPLWPKLSAYAEFAKRAGSPSLTAELPFYSEEVSCGLSGKLIVVGLNTALLSLDDQDSEKTLCLGRGQRLNAIEKQPSEALLLVLQHHPPEWLLDGTDLSALLQQRRHIQFSGHVHIQQGVLHGPILGGSRLQFVAGAGHKDRNEEGRHAFAWGQLSEEGLTYYSWIWQPDRHAFALTPMLDTDDFKQGDHVFVERARLPKSIQAWLPSPPSSAPSSPALAVSAAGPANAASVPHSVRSASDHTSAKIYSPDNASHYVPYAAKGHNLIGRDEVLRHLHGLLQASGKGHRRAALSGIGGLGKTQLAAEYCHRHSTDYPGGIYWLDAVPQDIDGQLIALCDRARWLHPDSKHEEKLSVARQRLRSHGDSLLVFDNTEELDSIRGYFSDPSRNNSVLILCRNEVPGWPTPPIQTLSSSDSMRLLEVESGRTPTTTADRDAAAAIAKQLDGLPLALELVGAYLKRRPAVTWADCASDLVRRGVQARSLNWAGFDDASVTRHGADLHAALSLDEDLFTDTPLLRRVLDLLAWAGPSSMGHDLLSELLDKPEPGDLIDALALGEQLRILSVELDTGGGRRVRMHRLVQQVHRRKLSELTGDPLASLVDRLGNWFACRRADIKNLPQFEAELAHLSAFRTYANQARLWRAVTRLDWLEAYPPFHRGQYKLSQERVRAAQRVYLEHDLTDPLLRADLLADLGSTDYYLGKPQEALKLQQQALDIRREVQGDKHPDTATALGNLGATYSALGKPQEALKLQQQALDILREVLGDKHPDTAKALGNLGATYADLRDFGRALQLAKDALSIRLEVLGPQHPETITMRISLANCWLLLKQGNEALITVRQGLHDAAKDSSEYAALKELEQRLLTTGGRPIQNGFRTPPQRPKRKHKR